MELQQIISLIKDIILGGAAIVGACVAVRGLNTWNRQLKGSAEYDLARRILKLTYRFRDAINQVRHPAMRAYEIPSPPEEEAQHMSAERKRYYGLSRAYQARGQKVSDIRSALQTELLEAEVLWGKGLQDKFAVVFQLEHKLFVAIRDYLALYNSDENEAIRAAIQAQGQQSKIVDIMYDSLEESGDDFKKEYQAALKPIEEYLKPHLRRKA